MWRRWVTRAQLAVNRPWPLIPFTPIIMAMLWGAALRLWGSPHGPDALPEISDTTYIAWLITGSTGPPLALLAWWLITKRDGIWRWRGMVFRFAGDLLAFVYVLAYHIAVVIHMPANEARAFSRYNIAAILIFLLSCVVRDVWSLLLTENVARRIHRGRGE